MVEVDVEPTLAFNMGGFGEALKPRPFPFVFQPVLRGLLLRTLQSF